MRFNKLFRVFLLALVALTGRAALSQAPLTDDSYTTPGQTSANGGGPYLLVQAPSTSAYVHFDLTALPSGLTASNIQKANLRLYIDAITQAGSIDVRLVSAAWSESTITASNAPAAGAMVASAVAIKPKKQFIDIDVTSAVTAWMGGTANNGLVLSPSAGSSVSVSFDAKENTNTSHNAELDLVLVTVGPQGPQGIQGIQGLPGQQGIQGIQGAQGIPGIQGLPGPAGPQGLGGLNGFQQFFPSCVLGGLAGITCSTSTNYFTVPQGITKIQAELYGAGAGGGSAGGGGGGAYVRLLWTVNPGDVLTITVGAGGSGLDLSGNPGAGGDTAISYQVASVPVVLATAGGGQGSGIFNIIAGPVPGPGGIPTVNVSTPNIIRNGSDGKVNIQLPVPFGGFVTVAGQGGDGFSLPGIQARSDELKSGAGNIGAGGNGTTDGTLTPGLTGYALLTW